LNDINNDDGWTFVQNTMGIKVHYRCKEGSKMHEVKTHATFEAPKSKNGEDPTIEDFAVWHL
jgi:hypothetical protein